MAKKSSSKADPPFETRELRASLKHYLSQPFKNSVTGEDQGIGSFKWGVYIFYDYDGEPIYVGQTNEQVSQRIGRHLTNQRTDAVAMSVLDPFEVAEIEVFPLPQYEEVGSKHRDFKAAKTDLDALEYAVHQKAIKESKFKAILNEKDPPAPAKPIALPRSCRGSIVSAEVKKLRSHPDVRTARRAQIISRLSQTISERQVQNGLRRTLVTQATRLQWLAKKRFDELGGDGLVEKKAEDEEDDT